MSDTTSPCNPPYRLRSSNLCLQGGLSAGGPPSDVGSVAPAEAGQAYKMATPTKEAGPASPVTSILADSTRTKRAATTKNPGKVIYMLHASVIHVLDPLLSLSCPYTMARQAASSSQPLPVTSEQEHSRETRSKRASSQQQDAPSAKKGGKGREVNPEICTFSM